MCRSSCLALALLVVGAFADSSCGDTCDSRAAQGSSLMQVRGPGVPAKHGLQQIQEHMRAAPAAGKSSSIDPSKIAEAEVKANMAKELASHVQTSATNDQTEMLRAIDQLASTETSTVLQNVLQGNLQGTSKTKQPTKVEEQLTERAERELPVVVGELLKSNNVTGVMLQAISDQVNATVEQALNNSLTKAVGELNDPKLKKQAAQAIRDDVEVLVGQPLYQSTITEMEKSSGKDIEASVKPVVTEFVNSHAWNEIKAYIKKFLTQERFQKTQKETIREVIEGEVSAADSAGSAKK